MRNLGALATNVLPLHEVGDASELSSVCQDKTFFVKMNINYQKTGNFLKRRLVAVTINLL